MPRPCKRRRVCEMPGCIHFGPKTDSRENPEPVIMTIDEYEAIRLIDLEGLTQEQCAERMDVARTTAQAIYNNARGKLAQCLVYERELHIQGGDYTLCNGESKVCGCGHHCHLHCHRKEL